MSLIALGLNHRTAPVDIRERVAFPPETIPDALRALTAHSDIKEAAILSTCNRTEVYVGLDGANDEAVIDWFRRYHNLSETEVRPFLYAYPDRHAVRHILRVASGLDSMVLGEPQILGQMKQAFGTAQQAGTIGFTLNRLFQHTFSVAKQVRTDTAIGASPVSVAFAAVSLSKQIFSDFRKHTALLIGAGETIELVARHLHENGIGRMIIANRTLERAHSVAAEFDAYAIGLPELPSHLAEADLVIASTASPLPILGKGAVERAIKARKRRPMLLVDIAVPRDIEPEVANLEDVYLYTVDDLKEIIDEGLKSRQEAAHKAEEIIDTQVSHFMGWLQSLSAVETIRLYREQSEALRDEMLAMAMKQLATGKEPAEVLNQFARLLTNKLIHTPCAQMKRAGFEGRFDLLLAAQQLLSNKVGE